ncbi:DUF2000 domain-containing protein [Anaerolentibacter hominis]|uniref:DUF2000 domain-containing protein n=1 Tax=Anaerolentibacter hominis TaxID=3079009 RepID=UPI003CCEE49A
MDTAETKCVIVLDEALPAGVLTNTAAIMGMTLGKCLPEAVGEDVVDSTGCCHPGIVTVPVPVLKCDRDTLKHIRSRLYEEAYSDLTVVDFTDVARSCRDYSEYTRKTAGTAEHEMRYLGIAICGNRKKVSRLTGNMPLLR